MSMSTRDINDFEWEHREQREQSCEYGGCECSHADSSSGNNGNELISIAEIVDLECDGLYEPDIIRPSYMSHPVKYKIAEKIMPPGLYYHGIYFKDGKEILTDEWICSPLTVDAITSSINGDNFGRLLKFVDSNGSPHEWAMPMHMLKSSGEELLGELLSQGITFSRKKRSTIIDYIMTEQPIKKITAASKVGWHEDIFVLPNKIIGKSDSVVFQSEGVSENDFVSSGTVDDWNHHIGRLCIGNIPLIVSVCTALAGALLKRVHRKQGGGIHWVGDSSIGKSTVIEVAASVWGSPEFVRSWSVTANGFEGIAATRNDTCLILDEINEVSPCDVGKIVYMLVNGQGKQRAGRIGNARQIQRWRLMAVSSGERTLESVMNEVGKQTNSGQLVRLLNIPAAFEYGVFSELHEFIDGRTLADHFKNVYQKYYGLLGPLFVEKLIDDTNNLSDCLDSITKNFLFHAHTNIEKRAASTFALIAMAGEMAIGYGLLPWEIGSALDATMIAFKRWQTFQGASQTEDSKILESINSFINKHGDSRFSLMPYHAEDKSVLNRAGWYRDSAGKRIFMFTPTALQEAGGGYDKARVVDTLSRYGWIADTDSGRFTKKTRTSAGSKNLYHIFIPDQEDEV